MNNHDNNYDNITVPENTEKLLMDSMDMAVRRKKQIKRRRTVSCLAAALAVVRIPCNLVRAAGELQAVWCHDEQLVRRYADLPPSKQQIAHRDKGTLEPTSLDAEDVSEIDRKRKERIDELIRLLLQDRQIRPTTHGEHHIEDAKKGKKDHSREHDAQKCRQPRLDGCQAWHADIADEKEHERHAYARKGEHTDEKSFFRPPRDDIADHRRLSPGIFPVFRFLCFHRNYSIMKIMQQTSAS